MKIKNLISENWTLVLYFILSIFAILPILSPGFFDVHDNVQVARVFEMAKSLSSFQFPVRWVPDLGYGAGYPIFNFYSLLPYYFGGLFVVFGLTALLATKIVFITGIILSGFSMYLFVKSIFGKSAALVSSIIYLYFPYHAVNIYVRGDVAEFFAYAFLPLVFLSVYKLHLSQKFSRGYVVLGIISLTAVIISHNLSAFMLFIFLGIYSILSIIFSKNKKVVFLSYAIIIAVSLLLSAFYIIPAISEMKYTNIQSVLGPGSYYADNFICPAQLWNSPWGFGGSAKGCVDGLSFKLGKFNILLVIAAIGILIYGIRKLKEHKFFTLMSVFFLFLAIFMTLSYSLPLWKLPYMNFLQFPWRFLNFVGLFISVLAGFLVWRLDRIHPAARWIVPVVIIGITIYMNMSLFTPQRMNNVDSSYYTNRDYLNWTASKISDEYMPKGFVTPKSKADIGKSLNNIKNKQNNLFNLETSTNVRFKFSQTPIEMVSNFITIIGVFVLTIVIIHRPRKEKRAG